MDQENFVNDFRNHLETDPEKARQLLLDLDIAKPEDKKFFQAVWIKILDELGSKGLVAAWFRDPLISKHAHAMFCT